MDAMRLWLGGLCLRKVGSTLTRRLVMGVLGRWCRAVCLVYTIKSCRIRHLPLPPTNPFILPSLFSFRTSTIASPVPILLTPSQTRQKQFLKMVDSRSCSRTMKCHARDSLAQAWFVLSKPDMVRIRQRETRANAVKKARCNCTRIGGNRLANGDEYDLLAVSVIRKPVAGVRTKVQ